MKRYTSGPTTVELDQKALKLLGILSYNAENGTDNIKYLAFVLQSWYDDGYWDALQLTKESK